MLKISESYFQSLLTQQDAIEAVSTLSGFWSHRANQEKHLFGLSLPEYQCQLILIYTGEVGNGGHLQFFANRHSAKFDDHIVALDAAGLPALAKSLRDAMKLRDKVEKLKIMDQQVWTQSSDVDQALQDFLRKHSQHVLVSERSQQADIQAN